MKVDWHGTHPDEGSIHAWLDGEIDADDAARLEAHLGACEDCTAAVAEARGLVAGAARVVGMLDAAPPALVRPAITPTRAGSSPAWRFLRVTPARAAIAAALLVAVGITLTRKQGAFEDFAVRRDTAALATAPAATTDHLLDSAIGRKLAEEQPPRSVSAAAGLAVPAAPAPSLAKSLDTTSSALRVAAAKASLRAQADSSGAPADRARVGFSNDAALARTTIAGVAAEGAAQQLRGVGSALGPVDHTANRCLRLETTAGVPASWGTESLPVTLVFDATGRLARVFSAAGTATDEYTILRTATADSLTLQLRRIGYNGMLSVTGAGEQRSGVLRSAPIQMNLESNVVTADSRRVDSVSRLAARAGAQASNAAAPSAPPPAARPVQVTARFVSCPTG